MKLIAQRLGLEDIGHEIRGVLDGQRVQGSWLMHGTWHVGFSAVSHVSPPIDLGLVIESRTEIFSGHPLAVSGWRNLSGRADEPSRWAALFANVELVDAIADASRDRLVLNDKRCEISGGAADDWLESAIRRAARVTRALSEAAARVPVASALTAHRAFWREYAEVHSFAGTDTPLAMWGPVSGGGLAVRAHLVATASYQIQARLEFAHPLGLGLSLRPASWASTLFDPDVAVGDIAFDKMFEVRSRAGGDVARVLDADVRTALVELEQRIGTVELDDAAITVMTRRFSPEPADVGWLLEKVRDLARRMVQNATGAPESGAPYR